MIIVVALDLPDEDGNHVAIFKREVVFEIGELGFGDEAFHFEPDIHQDTVRIFPQNAGLNDCAGIHLFGESGEQIAHRYILD